MQIANNKRREDVAMTIRSCLIARKEEVTLKMLERDYEDIEGEKIPFREFSCPSLLAFLDQLQNILWVDTKDGKVIIRPVESEKSRHVSSLVRRQRQAKDRLRKMQRPYFGFQGGGTRVSIDSRLMMNLVKLVKTNYKGISIDTVVDYVNKFSCPVRITRGELEHQLREISHEILIWGDNLYSTNRVPPSPQRNSSNSSPGLKPSSPSDRKNDSCESNSRLEKGPEPRSNVKPIQTYSGKKKHREAPAEKSSQEDCKAEEKDEVLFRPAGFTDFGEPQKPLNIERKVSYLKNKALALQNGYKDQHYRDQRNSNQGGKNAEREENFNKNQELQDQNSSKQSQNLCLENVPFRDFEFFIKDSNNLYKDRQNSSANRESSSKKNQNSSKIAKDSSRDKFTEYNENSHGKEGLKATCDEDCQDEEYEDKGSLGDNAEKDFSLLIEISTKIRLTKLIQQYPDGIWCAEFPKKYLREYQTPLIYEDLGFISVQDFASHFPNIFHCIKPAGAGDYKLYNVDKPPPDLRNDERAVNENLASFKQIYKAETLPEGLDLKVLLPEGAMGVEEYIKPISVADLGSEDGFEEVEISEVFSPSFFWVQLRRNLMKFKKFLDELNHFYEKNQSKFKISLIFLEKGLNVACIHSGKWQRGIIKSVFPDGRTTVHFCDSGFEKSYALNEIFFLHRQFSYLPAQAIPCGLFNVKPFQTSKWNKSVTWEFISKTSIPLIATIGSINLQENSMLVTLTDTRGEEDFHINDWMYEEKLGEKGQTIVKNRNIPFIYYKECLERKGYDPSAIHKIRSQCLNSNGYLEHLETEAIKYRPVEIKPTEAKSLEIKPLEIKSTESQSDESRPGFLRFKRTQALLVKYQAKQEAETMQSNESQKEIPSSVYKNSESSEVSPSKSTSSIESEPNIKFTPNFLLKQSLNTRDIFKNVHSRSLFGKPNWSNQKEYSVEKVDTSLNTNNSSKEHIPICSPHLPKEIKSSGKNEQDSFFGSIKSECGGNGRMEPINWTEVRSALVPKNNQFSEKIKMDLKATALEKKIPKSEVPVAKPSFLNVVENDLNSTFYEKNVHWVPADNFSSSISSRSPLLNLKQRLHANSYKQSDVLISSKVVGIWKSEMQNSEDEIFERINKKELNIQKQKEVSKEKRQSSKTEMDQAKQKEQLPPRILRLLEIQNKGKIPVTTQTI